MLTQKRILELLKIKPKYCLGLSADIDKKDGNGKGGMRVDHLIRANITRRE